MKIIAFAIVGFILVTPLMAQEVLEITVGEFPPFTGFGA